MSSTGTGYDLEASTFSPDGRIFQVEYSNKAVENSGTAIALRGKDGVVIAVEKLVQSKLIIEHTSPRVIVVSENAISGGTGVYPDLKAIVKFTADEALSYFEQRGELMPGRQMVKRLSEYMHAYTLYGMVRPFGCAMFLGVWSPPIAGCDDSGPKLFMVEPSGVYLSYKAWALGKGRQAAKTEIEKLKLENLTCQQLVTEATRILHVIRDQTKDKNMEIDIAWIGQHTQGKAELVPLKILIEAEDKAKKFLAEQDA